ncbi:MAG: hypothetical protein RLN78_04545 [Phycisphaerales bacterium]
MIDSGTMIVLITALASAVSVLCLYSVYGNVIRHETTLHDLRHRVETLQNQQALHLAEIKGQIPADDEEDDDTPPMSDSVDNNAVAAVVETHSDQELSSSSTKAA